MRAEGALTGCDPSEERMEGDSDSANSSSHQPVSLNIDQKSIDGDLEELVIKYEFIFFFQNILNILVQSFCFTSTD